jgi:glycosyltransferase involved in cell wall biosynthesis
MTDSRVLDSNMGKGNALNFLLSEMSVSDLHGGGLTLQRILGEDLDRIALFVHPHRFARELPPTPRLRARSEFVVNLLQKRSTARLIGCRASYGLFNTAFMRSRHARKTARVVEKRFPAEAILRGLICPQDQDAIRALEYLKSIRQVKYITWMMDDYMVGYVGGRWVYPPTFRKIFGKHLREADTIFVISPAMAEFYAREFGVESTVLFGPSEEFSGQACEAPSADGVLRIAYFGSLWRWQLDGLVRFASALDPSRQQLDIYTPDAKVPAELHLPGVAPKGFLSKETVPSAMRSYDAVLLPLSLNDAHRNLVELNIATKMSECLASGTVTIVFGPSYAAMVRFLRPTGAACVVTGESLTSWPHIADQLRDRNYRRRILDAARSLVRAELSTEVMRRKWRYALEKLTAPCGDGDNRLGSVLCPTYR